MHKITKLKNGLTLITIPLDHLDSVTTMVIVGAGSRYETRKNSGISHFLEHMFFKGSKKYPSAEEISKIVDGMGAIHNAATSKEWTYYWIKSAAKHMEKSSDILSSMIKESLLLPEEIDREKGVILEEIRGNQDNPSRIVWDLYERLLFGDHPLGWFIIGSEGTIQQFNRQDFVKYMTSLYSPENMVIVYAGKLPANIKEVASRYFVQLQGNSSQKHKSYSKPKQDKPKVDIYYKKTDQVNLILGMEGYARNSKKRFAAQVLGVILGEGMSSRLFIQIRERRGLAYHVSAEHEGYLDTGSFSIYGGLKLEKIDEALKVIKAELYRLTEEVVSEEELRKAKELIRGRLSIRSESTNFLAQYFGIQYILDKKIETFDEFLKDIDAVNSKDIQAAARELFKPERFNLQIVGPFKKADKFVKILRS